MKQASTPRLRRAEHRSDAAGPGARGTCPRRRARPLSARYARASRSRKRTTNRARTTRLCSDGGGAWIGTRAREGVAPRVRRARAPSPARGSQESVRVKASHLASVVRALRALRAEAESALSVHESVKPASVQSGVPSTDPTAKPVLAFLAHGACARRRARAPVEHALRAPRGAVPGVPRLDLEGTS